MAPTDPYATPASRYYALGVLTLVYTFNFVDRQLLAILQESIKADLALSDAQLGLLTGFAFAVFYVTAGIPIARWADRGNRRNIVALAVGTWSFMTAISGAAQSYSQLLLARIGVGVGEAGGSPPAHSMVSDIFPPERRASALSLYSTGVNLGILFGFLFGGILNDVFGWRIAFVVVGLPGILVALIVRFTLAEPVRGMSERHEVIAQAQPFGAVLRFLWQRITFRHMAMAAAANAFAVYSMSSWTASFMIRSFDKTSTEVGAWLAMILGLGGALGLAAGGFLAERLSHRDMRWYMWVPALAAGISVPFMIATFTAETFETARLWFIIPGFLSTLYLGSTLAMAHGLVAQRMRALTSAILFFVLNLIGLGLGPASVGLLSDLWEPTYGVESLRHAMLILIPLGSTWSLVHFVFAAHYLREDLARAPA